MNKFAYDIFIEPFTFCAQQRTVTACGYTIVECMHKYYYRTRDTYIVCMNSYLHINDAARQHIDRNPSNMTISGCVRSVRWSNNI